MTRKRESKLGIHGSIFWVASIYDEEAEQLTREVKGAARFDSVEGLDSVIKELSELEDIVGDKGCDLIFAVRDDLICRQSLMKLKEVGITIAVD